MKEHAPQDPRRFTITDFQTTKANLAARGRLGIDAIFLALAAALALGASWWFVLFAILYTGFWLLILNGAHDNVNQHGFKPEPVAETKPPPERP